MLPKRFKYFISSLLSAFGFFMFIYMPYESRYYALLVGLVLIVICFWFGLGIVFEKSLFIRLMSIILPVSFFTGFGLFTVLFPYKLITAILMSVFLGIIFYIMFLVENVFLIAIGYRTPPLYRAAYTVSLILMLLTAFFLFDSLFSFRFPYWLNAVLIFLISCLIFLYQFFCVTIESTTDGKDKNIWAYVMIPSLLMAELALVFSFWPVGIFKGSIYLVLVIYILSGLLQSDIRERLFKRVWTTFVWVGVAILSGVVLMTSWR